MKIVIIGGTGLIGSKTGERLRNKGHEVIAASPNTGVDTRTGKGLPQALSGAQVVVDLANSPSFEDEPVMRFFETSGRNLLAAEATAGTKHHVCLSIVGSERLPDSGYLRAKLVQEKLIKSSGIPYTIVRSTQFFEFMARVGQSAAVGGSARVSTGLVQPIAGDDVADVMADVALAPPQNGTLEIAGPERMRLDEIVRKALRDSKPPLQVIGDPEAPYFGAKLDDRSLVPAGSARLGRLRFDEWLLTASSREH